MMSQMKQIIMHRLQLMNKAKMSTYEQQKFIDELLREKKKQNLRQIIEEKLLKSIIGKKIESPYRIQQFKKDSILLMQTYDMNFNYIPPNSMDDYTQIVDLYVHFFQQEGCALRADEITHVWRRRLCENDMLIPTLFNWFAEWTKKQFTNFLKINLNNARNYHQRVEHKKKKSLINAKINTTNWWPSSTNNQQISNNFKKRIKKQVNDQIKTKIKQNVQFQASFTSLKTKIQKNCVKVGEIDYITTDSIKQWQQQNQLQNVNRQVINGAFLDEMLKYYKIMDKAMPELNHAYLKKHRRNDRKQELTSKINQVTKILIKGQLIIKQQIDQYLQYYKNKIKKQNNNNEKAVKKKEGNYSTIEVQKNYIKKKGEINQFLDNNEIQFYSKNYQKTIELPHLSDQNSINNNKNNTNSKIILLHSQRFNNFKQFTNSKEINSIGLGTIQLDNLNNFSIEKKVSNKVKKSLHKFRNQINLTKQLAKRYQQQQQLTNNNLYIFPTKLNHQI